MPGSYQGLDGEKQAQKQPRQDGKMIIQKPLEPVITPTLELCSLSKIHQLGIHLDLCLLLEEQMEALAKKAFSHLQLGSQLWPSLEWNKGSHSCCCLHLDYYNLPWKGVPLNITQKLQLLQNIAAE